MLQCLVLDTHARHTKLLPGILFNIHRLRTAHKEPTNYYLYELRVIYNKPKNTSVQISSKKKKKN